MTNEMSPADYAAISGNNNDGFGGNNGAWWLIILFLFALCGGWGNGFGGFGGGGSQGASDNYVLASDFATIQRQLSDGFNSIDNALDRQNSGICDLGYTQAQLINNASMAQMQSANAIQSQLASCCCDIREGISNGFANVNYNMAMNSNALQNAIQTGFCQTNYNGQNNTRDIIDAQNAGIRTIYDKLCSMENNAKDERIASLMADNQALKFQASQTAQNAYLVDQLGYHCPQAAYIVQPPQTISFPNNCGVANYANNCGCGC